MTDRENLIELLYESDLACNQTLCEECDYLTSKKCKAVMMAEHLITSGIFLDSKQATSDKNKRWIHVTERLPEDDLPKDSKSKQIKVLVAYMRNGNWVIRTNLRKKGQWYKKPDEWSWSVSDPITHWMPLPEPPKEK